MVDIKKPDIGAMIACIDILISCIHRLIEGYKFVKKKFPYLKKKISVLWRYRNLLKHNEKSPCKNKLLYQYLFNITSDPYYSKKFQELPIESIQLFFRIYNTLRKKYVDRQVKFENSSLKSVIYIPVSSLRKCISTQGVKDNILILKDSGLVSNYNVYEPKFFQGSGNKLESYFNHVKNHSTVELEEGIIGIIPSQFGAKCYLMANDCQENIPEEDFCIVKIIDNIELDVADSFFIQDDISDYPPRQYIRIRRHS